MFPVRRTDKSLLLARWNAIHQARLPRLLGSLDRLEGFEAYSTAS
jgi:hypothetical protein